MQSVFNKILETVKKGSSCALATIVECRGSSPGKVSAKMLVYADSRTEGTVGGGSLEKQVILDALSALKRKRPVCKTYKLDKKAGLASCGGSVVVFIDIIEPERKLVIFGGGHIGLALSFVAKLMKFEVVVVDNRRQFANRKRFPHADEVFCSSYEDSFKKIAFDSNTYVVIVTHGHLHDADCLRGALKTKAGYIGMIGSRMKIANIFAKLKSEFGSKRLKQVCTPIGLDIGAQTPEEISVAIAAQLIEVSKKKS